MIANRLSPNAFRFAISGVMAMTMLAGCASSGKAPLADVSAARAQTSLAKGNVERAINQGESAVQASPRDSAMRYTLAQAYMKAGRFQSAATTFNDAMELGDNSARTALSLALSDIAAGHNAEAVAILDDWRDSIPASDLGLALSLAGESSRGVAILADALRAGDNTPKLRQNLAYSYALDGRWREARLMASQDLAADQVNDRLTQWAMNAAPEASQQRVAALLSTPVRADGGQPQQLALSNTPSAEQLAAESTAMKHETPLAATGELPPVEAQIAPAAPVQVASVNSYTPVQRVEAAPVAAPMRVAATPLRSAVAYAAPVRAAHLAQPARPVAIKAATVAVSGTHLVQLGSFSSAQGARRAWGIFASRNPELKSHRMAITAAVVHGKNFWRVAAAGFNGNGAQGMCSSVKNRGGVCFAYAATIRAPSSVPGISPARSMSGPQVARR